MIGMELNARCGKCPPGTFYNSAEWRCDECPVNRFQPYENTRRTCLSCAGNEFSLAGAKECVACGLYEGLMRNGSCARCEVNSYYERDNLSCTKCEFNSFHSGAVDELCVRCRQCRQCPQGSVVRSDSASCEYCPDGTVGLGGGRCGLCPPGRYYVQDMGCRKCGEGSFQPVRSANSFCQLCPSGTTSNDDRTECIAL